MENAVELLDIVWNETSIMERLIDACLIREELQRFPIDLSDADVQMAVDGLRRTNKLFTVEDTERWMQQRGLTQEQLEELASDNFTVLKLRERLASGRVEHYFEAHRADFDTAHVARIECPDAPSAQLLHRQIVAGETDLFEAAQQQFLRSPKQAPSLFATLRRRDLAGASSGDLVCVGSVVTRVLSVTPAALNAETKAAIEEILFGEWLAERRRAASITWHWGRADRTPRAA
jgi:putative peptide maturation system protein